jgi:hypothetical protein
MTNERRATSVDQTKKRRRVTMTVRGVARGRRSFTVLGMDRNVGGLTVLNAGCSSGRRGSVEACGETLALEFSGCGAVDRVMKGSGVAAAAKSVALPLQLRGGGSVASRPFWPVLGQTDQSGKNAEESRIRKLHPIVLGVGLH